MPGKTSSQRAALNAQANTILALFENAGFQHIAPDILQPADVFLDRSGEDIRARTFVFTDPEGRELCLRPDLTVPACRYHLAHNDDPTHESRYCYHGPAFRYQPVHGVSQEFGQAGIEWFAAADNAAADAEILRLTITAIEEAGLKNFQVTLGDLGLFHGLLDSIDMPERWRTRLKHQFLRPREFRTILQILTGARPRPRTSLSPMIDDLADAVDADAALNAVEAVLDARDLSLVGGRSITDIANRIADKAADRRATPLMSRDAARIDNYLAIRGTPAEANQQLSALADDIGGIFAERVSDFGHRLNLMGQCGLQTSSFTFTTVFGRSLEYYTGLVFQITTDASVKAIAGGGRYDTMLSDIGAPHPVPAVGCAIHTERLLAAIGG